MHALRQPRPHGWKNVALAERVRDSPGTVIVENRPGAGGNIGADAVAKAAPDGNTLLMGAVATHAINPWRYARMPYDALRDFTPITGVAQVPNVLVMNPQAADRLGIRNAAELIAHARANPGQLNYGSGAMAVRGTSRVRCSRQRPACSWCTFPMQAATRRNWP